MESTIYLVRHGKPELPDDQMRFLGWSDLPLSTEGRRQAERAARSLSGLSFDRVVHSGLRRARETAEIIAAGRDVPFEELSPLREISFGDWELRSIREFAKTEPELFEARGKDFAGFRPPGGENFLDLRDRVMPAFYGLLEQERGDLLVAAHAGVIKTILFALLEIPLQRLFSIRVDYCGIQVISRMDGHLAIKRINWTEGLEGWE
ncbi:MAG: histidine phosphatase family protein [Synergistaceae bacterium]|nr:histidine phosphatase family protein [Synergistota bacterium]NLM71602.1 histidine phosphatase family protein [Synergistaceae bacterium]